MTKKIILYFLILILFILVIFYFIIGNGFGNKGRPDLVQKCNDSITLFAHRGISKYHPENSYNAIKSAKELGFCAIEIDIRQTKDEVFVLFHDPECSRLLNTDAKVSDLTYQQLKNFTFNKKSSDSNDRVIKLIDFLNGFSKDFIIYLDVKLDNEKLRFKKINQLADIIKNYNLYDNLILASADFLFIAYSEFMYPEIMTALEGFCHKKEWLQILIPINLKPDFLSSSYKDFSEKELPYLIENDLLSRRILYHVNGDNIKEYLNLGITKIIFDYDSTDYHLFPR